MKKTINTLVILLCSSLSVFAQAPNWSWAKSIGGTSDDEGYSITIDASGSVYTTGTFSDTVDFDPSPGTFIMGIPGFRRMFISKLDASGNFIWAKETGASGPLQNKFSITVDLAGNVYTTGHFGGTVDFDPGLGTFNLTASGQGDIFILKLDNSGNFIWAKQLGGTDNNFSYEITTDNPCNVYTAGHFSGTTDFNPGVGIFNLTATGPNDMFISKLDSSGNFVFAKQIGGTSDTRCNSITVDTSGNVYTTGSFDGTTDFDPGAAAYNLTTSGAQDIFISKLNTSGNFSWAKQIGGAGSDAGISITLDANGNICATGFFSNTVDFDPGTGTSNLTSDGLEDIFISKLDSSGNFIWGKSMGGWFYDWGQSITLDASGNIYTTGSFYYTADLDPSVDTLNFTSAGYGDIFITKLDGAGNFVWTTTTGGSGDDKPYAIALDGSGNAFITGYYDSPTLSFGTSTITNTNTGNEIFIAKLDTVIANGIESITNNKNGVGIYPNPACDFFSINLEGNQNDVNATIYDLTGKIIYTTTASNTQKLQVDAKEFSNGIYLLKIQTKDFVEARKLIISK